jgi:hypothetical protein
MARVKSGSIESGHDTYQSPVDVRIDQEQCSQDHHRPLQAVALLMM